VFPDAALCSMSMLPVVAIDYRLARGVVRLFRGP
jgi:hypothetical protein